jgi:peptide/nickel transport system substrate-binding protein
MFRKRSTLALLLFAISVAAASRLAPQRTTAQALPFTVHLPMLLASAEPALPAPPAQAGGKLVIGQGQEPDTLYLYGGSSLAATHIQNSLYDGPIDNRDYDYQPVIVEKLPRVEDEDGSAELALVAVEPGEAYVELESGEVVSATERVVDLPQLTVRFRLVPGLAWEDGVPVTAEDSVFSQQLGCHPDSPTSKFLCERTAAYTALDARTVLWQGLPGFVDQSYFINISTPLPRHQIGALGTRMDQTEPDLILEDEVFTRRPLSYGPFRIVEWRSGDQIRLVKNEHYWRADEGLPFLDEVIHVINVDSNSLLEALEDGEVDVATTEGLYIGQYEALEQAGRDGKLVPYYVAGPVWEHIDFNLDPVDGQPAIGACRDLRRAVAFGTDRPGIVDQAQYGQAALLDAYVPRKHWASADTGGSLAYEYDPDRARTLLDALGFADLDGDGYREATRDIECPIITDVAGTTKEQRIPRGTPLRLTLLSTEGNTMRENIVALYQQNMRDIGVKVEFDVMAANVLFEDGPEGPLFGRHFDLGLFAWRSETIPPASLYACSEIPSDENNWSGRNLTGWCDPGFDRAIQQAALTFDRAPARLLYQEAQRRFVEDLPSLPLFLRARAMATSPRVRNFRPDATVSSETWNIEEWQVEQAAGEDREVARGLIRAQLGRYVR